MHVHDFAANYNYMVGSRPSALCDFLIDIVGEEENRIIYKIISLTSNSIIIL